mgnify:CR=1 FL=1
MPTATGKYTINRSTHPELFDAWIAHYRANRKPTTGYLTHGFVVEDTIEPPRTKLETVQAITRRMTGEREDD